MITDERVTCSLCKYTEWWRSWNKKQPRDGAMKAGWLLRGTKWTCPKCREATVPEFTRTKFPEFKRTR